MIVKIFEDDGRKRAEIFHALAILENGDLRIMDRAFTTAEYAADYIADVYSKSAPDYCRWAVVKSVLDFSAIKDSEVQHAQHAAI